MLEDEELSLFMSEMDAGWALEPMPLETPSTVLPFASAPPPKKPRRSRRVDIMNTRKEMLELERELQILHEKHEFRESLKAVKSNYGLELRLSAWRERILTQSTRQKNARLHRLMDANDRLIKRISRLVQRQEAQGMEKTTPLDDHVANLDYNMYVYRVLQRHVDIRNKYQMDVIVDQCNQVFAGSDLEMIRWSTFALEDRGVGVGFHEAVVLPFTTTAVFDAIVRNCFANAHEVVSKNYVDKMTTQPVPEGLLTSMVTASDQHVTLRRLEHDTNCAIVLWDDATCWQSEDNCPQAFIRCSGWALITPVAGHADTLSAVHCGGFIQIHAMDGSSLKPTDLLVEDIVAYRQSLQRFRMAALDTFLL